jgi:hypothetical protein
MNKNTKEVYAVGTNLTHLEEVIEESEDCILLKKIIEHSQRKNITNMLDIKFGGGHIFQVLSFTISQKS